ncbi:uncharacterized protein I303_106563 [Kwoniella dejecticola CBS 10117]|uniref:Uncharacterized protein n=1 Tax=Kwoniella dejecticola CBS 10117 TaxID=1296121 RepID=A0A1A5ZUD1_9TREE|nr:uncharacterized protein I303_08180 [Kwoniella dejecticola CBS 10117]OBR81410.1 hypothetical protein I303_08180 [Kwoniella dejecticola CBS 10117]
MKKRRTRRFKLTEEERDKIGGEELGSGTSIQPKDVKVAKGVRPGLGISGRALKKGGRAISEAKRLVSTTLNLDRKGKRKAENQSIPQTGVEADEPMPADREEGQQWTSQGRSYVRLRGKDCWKQGDRYAFEEEVEELGFVSRLPREWTKVLVQILSCQMMAKTGRTIVTSGQYSILVSSDSKGNMQISPPIRNLASATTTEARTASEQGVDLRFERIQDFSLLKTFSAFVYDAVSEFDTSNSTYPCPPHTIQKLQQPLSPTAKAGPVSTTGPASKARASSHAGPSSKARPPAEAGPSSTRKPATRRRGKRDMSVTSSWEVQETPKKTKR